MTNPLEKFGISEADLIATAEVDAALDAFMADEVVPEWRRNSPVDTGEYRDSVQVTKRAKGGNGQVGALADYANIVEYGDEKTPEYAPRAKTEAHFNGPGPIAP